GLWCWDGRRVRMSRLWNLPKRTGRLNPEHEVMAFDEEYLRGLWNEICCDSEKDEVLRISHAAMSELFDRRLALPQYARKRIRWGEVVVSLTEGRAVAVQRFLARYIHFDAHGFLDLDRQLEEARLRMDASSVAMTAEDLSPE